MRHAPRAGAEDLALHDVLVAMTNLLERLAAAPTPADRALHGALFDAEVDAAYARLVREHGLDDGEADRLMARALEAGATLLGGLPDGG